MFQTKMANQQLKIPQLEQLSKLLYTITKDLYKDQGLEPEQVPTPITINKNDLENANKSLVEISKEMIINFLKETEYFNKYNFQCPITQTFLFEDKFVFLLYSNNQISKYGFNSNAIRIWMKEKSNQTCPITKQPIVETLDGQSEISLKLLECFIDKYQLLPKNKKVTINDSLNELISKETVISIETEIIENNYQFFIKAEREKIYNKLTLHKAVRHGHLEVVNFLLAKNVNVNEINQDRDTPLIIAVKNGYWEIVKSLVANGADINHQNKCGNTALILAAYKGHLKVVKSLVEKGVNINQKNENGDTALLLVAGKGYLEIVEFLLAKDAHINDENKYGNTALMVTAYNGHLKVVKSLLKKGADVNQINKDGNTALLLAAQNGHLEIKYIIEEAISFKKQQIDAINEEWENKEKPNRKCCFL